MAQERYKGHVCRLQRGEVTDRSGNLMRNDWRMNWRNGRARRGTEERQDRGVNMLPRVQKLYIINTPLMRQMYGDCASALPALYFLYLSAELTFRHHFDNSSCLSQNFTVMTFVFNHIVNRQCGWLAMPDH